MTKPIVLKSENACPECKGFNLSMQTNPVHDPVHHYECHDCEHSWDVQPNKGIVLTEEERTALEAVVSMLKFMYPAHTDPYQIAVPPLEQLLARSGGEGEGDVSV